MKPNYKQYANLIDIPEGKSGDFEIKHEYTEPGTILPTANLRTAFLGGDKITDVIFPERQRWHKLLEDGNTWMTDWPIEVFQMRKEVAHFRGDILIGGLGLGVVASILCQRKRVGLITIVEKSADVINLVGPHIEKLSRRIQIIHADLFDFLKTTEDKYNFAFYDIWQGDGERTFHNMVVPLRDLSRGTIKDCNITCWNEGVMKSQLLMNLQNRIQMPTLFANAGMKIPTWEELATLEKTLETFKDDIYVNWTQDFFQAAVKYQWDIETAMIGCKHYIHIYGRPNWKKKWNTISEYMGPISKEK
jgi:hypothetical protein